MYEPVEVALKLDIDRVSVLTGGTTTSLSEVRKPAYKNLHCIETPVFAPQ